MVINLKTTTSVVDRTETLMRFYKDIAKYPVLTQEDEIELISIIRNGNRKESSDARNLLVNSNQRFIVAVAKRYGTTDNILDLISEGNIGLMESIDSFDVNKNVKFTTWAIWYIRRAINQYCINYGSLIRKNNISKTYHVTSKATNAFVQENYRQPTMDELKDYMNEKFNIEIKDSVDVIDTQISSIDYDSNDDEYRIGDIIDFNNRCASYNEYEDNTKKDFNTILIKSMLSILTPREKKVMKMNFGIGYMRPYEIKEIAEELNLTAERIRQMRTSCLKRLKREYKRRINELL